MVTVQKLLFRDTHCFDYGSTNLNTKKYESLATYLLTRDTEWEFSYLFTDGKWLVSINREQFDQLTDAIAWYCN